ncbi:MAG TPA: DUF6483 family protein [Bacteroidota bacterium]|nr:DUF6483 family protein [Bacteroidota bacterium]
MLENDYIMRLVQVLTQALADILFFKKKKEFPKALDAIKTSSQKLLGVDLNVLQRLSEIQMIELLVLDPSMGKVRCYAAGMLLKEESEILAEEGKVSDSITLFTKALSLLAESAIRNNGPIDSSHERAIDDVEGSLRGRDVPVHIEKKLFYYYESANRYADAVEVLYDLLKLEPSYKKEGMEFCERLKEKSDEQLRIGKFSRKAVDNLTADLSSRKWLPSDAS